MKKATYAVPDIALRSAVIVVISTTITAYVNWVFHAFPGQVYPLVVAMVAALAWRFGTITAALTLMLTVAGIDWFVLDGDGMAIAKPEQAAGVGILLSVGTAAIWSMTWLRRDRDQRIAQTLELERRLDTKKHQIDELLHRISNDLASLSSLGVIYRKHADQGAAIAAMNERIAVFGRLYRRLNLPDTGDALMDMRPFLDGIMDDLKAAQSGLSPVVMEVICEPMTLPMKTAAVVALVVNESIQNARKYAFPDDRDGEILVTLQRGPREGYALLEIGDDGVGPSDGPPKGTGMGTRLMRAMAAQVSGRYSMQRVNGRTVVGVEFPIE